MYRAARPKRARYYQGMIDLNQIARGADYSELKKSYVIFICPFDYFSRNRHKYTFQNQCQEVPDLALEDGTWKIYFCAGSDSDDISPAVKDFLDYLVKREVKGDLAKKIDAQVSKAQTHEEWRSEYMSLYLRDLENQEIGKEIGKEQTLFSLVDKQIITLENGIRESGMTREEFLSKMKEAGYSLPE